MNIALIAAGFFALSGGAMAQAVATPHVSSQLVAQTQGAAPGSTLYVAVAQTLQSGWHTYWRNPGDAGEPTQITWTLPAGWRAGDIVWPAPGRFPLGPIMNYGFAGSLLLPTPIEVPADAAIGARVTVRAKVDYLVCADVCVPGEANLSLGVPVVAGAPPMTPGWGERIASALAASPKPGALIATYQAGGGRFRLAVTGPALAGRPVAEAYFYPYDGNLIDHGKPEAVERGPAGLALTMASGGDFAAGAAGPAATSGVLSVDGADYEITARRGPPPPGASGLGPPVAKAGGGGGLWIAAASAFLGGLILNLMPCVFPILSMKAAALAGHAREASGARAHGLAFLVGVLAAFLALAGALIAARAAGAAVGWGFQLQSPLMVAALSLVMLAAGLNLSGLFEIGTSVQGLGSSLADLGGRLGSLLTGVLAVVVAAPCTAPFMGPALGYALTQPAPGALAIFVALGLGFAAPFTLLAFSPALLRRLPRPGGVDGRSFVRRWPFRCTPPPPGWPGCSPSSQGRRAWRGCSRGAIALALAGWLLGLAQQPASIGRRGGASAGPGDRQRTGLCRHRRGRTAGAGRRPRRRLAVDRRAGVGALSAPTGWLPCGPRVDRCWSISPPPGASPARSTNDWPSPAPPSPPPSGAPTPPIWSPTGPIATAPSPRLWPTRAVSACPSISSMAPPGHPACFPSC